MTERSLLSIIPDRFLQHLITATLSIVFINNVLAQDIDLTQPCNNPATTLYAPLGSPLAINIGASNAPVGNVAWVFDSAPIGYSGVVCSGTNPIDCNGAIVTLPAAAPASQTTITGSAASGDGGFLMTLEAAVGITGCSRSYTVDFVQPFQTVLVLDRSGSMTGTSNISAPASTRWDALQLSVNNFSTHFVSAGEDSASELGISLFSNNIIANSSFSNTLETITNNLPVQIQTELSAQVPSGSTAMGTGIANALTKFTNAANPRAIILFTDGEQNVSPYVDINGEFLNSTGRSGCVAISADCTEIPADINIVSIGIGQPSADYLTTLMNLAATHNGYSIITSSSDSFAYANGVALGDVEAAFTNAIAPALSNNSPQMVAFNSGQLVGTKSVTLTPFEINKAVSRLVLQFSYSNKFETPNLANLLAGIRIEKDGNNITPYFSPLIVGNFSNSITLKTNFSAPTTGLADINADGVYVVTLAKSANIADLGVKMVAFADDHLLDIKWQVTPKLPKVTENFSPQVTLQWQGNPLETATVEAFILKPGDDLGDLLANYGGNVDPNSVDGEGTLGYHKYINLIENDANFLAQLLPSEQQLQLTHQANGQYQASFNPGDISGVYQVLYNIDYDSPSTGKITRLAMQSVYVRIGDLDLPGSQLQTSTTGNITTLTMKPLSSVGKLIGPGQQHAFAFSGSSLSQTSVTDHQDGSYTFTFTGDPNQIVTLKLLGEEVISEALNKLGVDQQQSPIQWLKWLLIFIIVLLLLIWFLRK